ncbi:Protein kinase, putative [Hondaea fermentalgiana]|uniref:Protein kinase, putative n=1 Tax=Hondaea fermentalgiana TaxID=2315210 RepID=A0A2R5GT39_9STRA|nr:Protein kinase, putative [Hondaea fermentalgiana]|eukprot:GBG33755.1 Protein kinase, putative [Hondaea fermentalgiana]
MMDDDGFVAKDGDVVNEYTLGALLGQGSFGEVREGRKGDDLFAVKCLSRSFLKKKREFKKEGRRMKVKTALDDVQREIAIMKKVHHPNLVGLVEAIDNEDTDNLYIVLEFVSGGQVMYWSGADARYSKKGGGVYSENAARPIAQGVLDGLRYLHAQDIIHRDLKPENLLLASDGRVKIGDFGIAQKLELEKTQSASLSNMQGTYQFMAPEMITDDKYNGYLIDIWAFGVCLYAFVNGELPFYGADAESVFEAIEKGKLVIPEGLSDPLSELLAGVLEKDPKKRLGMTELIESSWFEFSDEELAQPDKVELTESEREQAITPFQLDLYKIVNAKKHAKLWRKAASSSKGLRDDSGLGRPSAASSSANTLHEDDDVDTIGTNEDAHLPVSPATPNADAAVDAAAPPVVPVVASLGGDCTTTSSPGAASTGAGPGTSPSSSSAAAGGATSGPGAERPKSSANRSCCNIF